jgi:hypothetical protein
MKQVERTGDLEKECGRREVGGTKHKFHPPYVCQRTMARRAELELVEMSLSLTREKGYSCL